MFERLILGNAATVCTFAAFAFAASIFVGIAWRAVRMSRAERERFARLPFDTDTPACSHDHRTRHDP
jgi:hypothetical protein